MARTARRWLGSAVLVLLVTIAVSGGVTRAEPAGQAAPAVTAGDNFFEPVALTVKAGTQVDWTNTGSLPHTVTADDVSFDSGILNPGDSFSFSFTVPGTFAYHCIFHPEMTGTITVEDAGSAQEVTAGDNFFEPAVLAVQTGTTVTWTNTGDAPHTVTADDGSFDSGLLAAGAGFSFTFTAAGTFTYHCEFHPEMTGTIAVEPAGSARAPTAGNDVLAATALTAPVSATLITEDVPAAGVPCGAPGPAPVTTTISPNEEVTITTTDNYNGVDGLLLSVVEDEFGTQENFSLPGWLVSAYGGNETAVLQDITKGLIRDRWAPGKATC